MKWTRVSAKRCDKLPIEAIDNKSRLPLNEILSSTNELRVEPTPFCLRSVSRLFLTQRQFGRKAACSTPTSFRVLGLRVNLARDRSLH
jgi:hypothetical protein